MRARFFRLYRWGLVVGLLALTACSMLGGTSKPMTVIVSPPSGSQYKEGEEVAVQSTSTDGSGIVRVELIVDNVIVRTDPSPSPQATFSLIQTWQATAGSHTIIVRSYNSAGSVSDPAAISINVLQQISQASSSSTASASSSASSVSSVPPSSSSSVASSASSTSSATSSVGCVNAFSFVADVTIPDGTNVGANTDFTKVWRISNTGSCAWGAGYNLIHSAGTAMTANISVAVPNTAPGATVDLPVAMKAPAGSGAVTGTWRMRAPNGTLFGNPLTVKINVVGGASSSASSSASSAPMCSGTPNIASFTASSATIVTGNSVTLNWGAVTNAESAEIDQGIGGVETPGSRTVNPGATTTYTLLARCGANTKTATVTVTVVPPLPPAIALTVKNSLGGTESGTVYEPAASLAVVNGTMIVGDIAANKVARAYMSFDISDMGGKTIVNATLDLSGCSQVNNLFAAPMSGLWVGELQYGLPLDQSDYNLSTTGIVHLTAKPTSPIDVKSYVISRVSQGKTRFQIRLHPYGPTDNDGQSDYLSCGTGVPKLGITYQ